jgi:hypothetical protein
VFEEFIPYTGCLALQTKTIAVAKYTTAICIFLFQHKLIVSSYFN